MKRTLLIYAGFGLFLGIFGAAQASAQARYLWSGVWNVPSRFAPATLTIRAVTAKTFRFKIEAMNGANMGEVSGIATIKGNKAFFDDGKQNSKPDDVYGCKLTFAHKGTFIDVDMNNECLSYAGSGVFFAEKYYKGKPKPRETDFVYLEVFPDMTHDRKFKALVGKDYERFLDSFHQIYTADDLDAFGAKVFAGCVRGICPWMAAIIIYDAKGNIWAAVLDDSVEDKLFAYYYTNVAGWSDKLPMTIDKWISEKRGLNDGNLTVVFKNKK